MPHGTRSSSVADLRVNCERSRQGRGRGRECWLRGTEVVETDSEEATKRETLWMARRTRLGAGTCANGASRDSEPSAGRGPASTQRKNLETKSSKDLNFSFIGPKGECAPPAVPSCHGRTCRLLNSIRATGGQRFPQQTLKGYQVMSWKCM